MYKFDYLRTEIVAMILLALFAIADGPTYDPRLISAGAPAFIASFAHELRICGYEVSARPFRDGDILPKPVGLSADAQVLLADQPIDLNSPKMECFRKAEERIFRAKTTPAL
jgi:hypothetical protein